MITNGPVAASPFITMIRYLGKSQWTVLQSMVTTGTKRASVIMRLLVRVGGGERGMFYEGASFSSGSL